MYLPDCLYHYRFVPHQDCYDIFDELYTPRCPAPKIYPENLCAKSLDGDGDICQGDSGGGLVALDKNNR